MATVFSNNVVEIAVQMSYGGRPAVNVWHMKDDDFIAQQSITELVRDFANAWQDHVMPYLVGGVVLTGFEYRSLDSASGDTGILTPDGAKATSGGIPGAGLPPNVAYLVHKRTNNRPRGRRDGRCFLPGVQESNVDDAGVVNGAHRNNMQSFLNSFYSSISDTGAWNTTEHYPVVLETTAQSRAPGTQSVTIGSRRVTSVTLDSKVATMRERLR